MKLISLGTSWTVSNKENEMQGVVSEWRWEERDKDLEAFLERGLVGREVKE